MNFGIASLSKVDLAKLSQEMAKMGGGVNIRTLKPTIYTTKTQKGTETNKGKDYKIVDIDNIAEAAHNFIDNEQGAIKSYLLAGFNVNFLVCDTGLFSLEYPTFVKQIANEIWEHSNCKVTLSLSKCFIVEDSHSEQFIDLLNINEKAVGKLKGLKYFDVKDERDIALLFEFAKDIDDRMLKTRHHHGTLICKLALQKGGQNDFYSELTMISLPTKAKKNESFHSYIAKFTRQMEETFIAAQKQSPVNNFMEEKREGTQKLALSKYMTKTLLKNCINMVYFQHGEKELATTMIKNFAPIEVIAFKNQPNQPIETFAMSMDMKRPRESVVSSKERTSTVNQPTYERVLQEKSFLLNTTDRKTLEPTSDPLDISNVKEFEFKRKYHKYDLDVPRAVDKENNPAEMNNASLHLLNIDYQQNFQRNMQFRQELVQQKDSLENEIIEMKAHYESELENYRKSVSELNTRLQLVISKDPDLKQVFNVYDKEIIRLELQNKNLNERLQSFLKVETNKDDAVEEKRIEKYKNLAAILNADLLEKEKELNYYRKSERANQLQNLVAHNFEEAISELRAQNKGLNIKMGEQQNHIEDLNQAIEELRVQNRRLNNEKNLEAIERLNLKEENLILKDMIDDRITKQSPEQLPFVNNLDQPSRKEDLVSLEKISREAMMLNLKEFREYILNEVKLDRDTLHYKLDTQETVSHQFLSKFHNTNKRHQSYIELLTGLQDRIEESLGKNHNLTRQLNREIRAILSSQLELE